MPIIIDGKVVSPPTDQGSPGGPAISIGELPRIKMDPAPDASGGVTTVQVGFQVVDGAGKPIKGRVRLQALLFDDANYQVSSIAGTLGSVSQGSIVSIEPSAALQIETDPNTGRFQCELVNPNPNTTVFFVCDRRPGGTVIDCSDFMTIGFTTP